MRKAIIEIVSKHYYAENERHNTFFRDEIKNSIILNVEIPIGILPTETTVNYTTGDN